MQRLQTDIEVERLVGRSVAFRAARSFLRAIDAAASSSALVRVSTLSPSRGTVGLVLLAAAATHGVLETLLPGSSATLGRYLFAASGAIVGALLLTI